MCYVTVTDPVACRSWLLQEKIFGTLEATKIKGCQTNPAAEQGDAELPTLISSRMLFTVALPWGLHMHRGHLC